MFNHTQFSYTDVHRPVLAESEVIQPVGKDLLTLEPALVLSPSVLTQVSQKQNWLAFATATFLVSVPVFLEAPLVRSLPSLSLGVTGLWICLSFVLMSRPKTYFWGDLLWGFSWSWLAGSIYWGWLRWEPLWHLPVESIGLPFAIWCIKRHQYQIGSWFYLGSLLGTCVTDIYFYLVNLLPYWRQIMVTDVAGAGQILKNALAQVQTPWGVTWALIIAAFLVGAGILPLNNKKCHWYAFSGAVLSTILVDSLFLLAAIIA